jgi:hypothetical protein
MPGRADSESDTVDSTDHQFIGSLELPFNDGARWRKRSGGRPALHLPHCS